MYIFDVDTIQGSVGDYAHRETMVVLTQSSGWERISSETENEPGFMHVPSRKTARPTYGIEAGYSEHQVSADIA